MRKRNCEKIRKEIDELKKDIQKSIHERNGHPSIAGLMKNQKKIDFFFAYFNKMSKDHGWKRNTTYASSGFSHIRDLALLTVASVDDNNEFSKHKIKDLTEKELLIATCCADALVDVLANYKQFYLESEGRKDIPEAFNMPMDDINSQDDNTTEMFDGMILCCGYDTGWEKDINFCPKCGKRIVKRS